MYILPEIIVYKDANFSGESLQIICPAPLNGTSFGWDLGGDFKNSMSSVIIKAGTWQFWEHEDGSGANTVVGPGYYKYVEDAQFNMVNDTIESLYCISDQPQGDNPVNDFE